MLINLLSNTAFFFGRISPDLILVSAHQNANIQQSLFSYHHCAFNLLWFQEYNIIPDVESINCSNGIEQ